MQEPSRRADLQVIFLIFGALFLLLLWSAWSDLSHLLANWSTSDATAEQVARAGQWGDSFGALNALTSAAGFAIILLTLLVQSRAIREQGRDLHRQRFESSFFELMKLMRELRAEISFSYSKYYISSQSLGKSSMAISKLSKSRMGLRAIRSSNIEIVHWLVKQGIAKSPTQDEMVNIYMRRVHSKSEASLGPYFRTIYTILYRIESDKILSKNEKIRYGNLLRGQLTSPEIVLLSINALAPVANDLRKYLTIFRMLKYLPVSNMRRRLERFYPAETFLARD